MSIATVLFSVALILAIVAAFPGTGSWPLLNVAVILIALGLLLGSGLVR